MMSKNKISKITLIILGIISFIYASISCVFLSKYVIEFFKGSYIIEPNDLPNYSDIFNSIFVLLSILSTSIFSYILYKLNKRQINESYNKDVGGPALMIYYTLKLNIMRNVSIFLNNNIDNLEEQPYKRCIDNTYVSSLDYIRTTTCPYMEYTNEIKEYLPRVMGYIEDEGLRNKLFIIYMDLYQHNGNQNSERFIYVLNDSLVHNRLIKESNSSKWVYVLSNMHNNNWTDLSKEYKELMEVLYKISKIKK